MNIGALTLMTLTGSLIVLKVGVMALGLILLAKAMQHASHPGSMDPTLAEVKLHKPPQL